MEAKREGDVARIAVRQFVAQPGAPDDDVGYGTTVRALEVVRQQDGRVTQQATCDIEPVGREVRWL